MRFSQDKRKGGWCKKKCDSSKTLQVNRYILKSKNKKNEKDTYAKKLGFAATWATMKSDN